MRRSEFLTPLRMHYFGMVFNIFAYIAHSLIMGNPILALFSLAAFYLHVYLWVKVKKIERKCAEMDAAFEADVREYLTRFTPVGGRMN